jgi:hypothetical protein
MLPDILGDGRVIARTGTEGPKPIHYKLLQNGTLALLWINLCPQNNFHQKTHKPLAVSAVVWGSCCGMR